HVSKVRLSHRHFALVEGDELKFLRSLICQWNDIFIDTKTDEAGEKPEHQRRSHDPVEAHAGSSQGDNFRITGQSIKYKQRAQQYADGNGHHNDFRQVQTENHECHVDRHARFHDQVEDDFQLIRAEPHAGNNAYAEQQRLPEFIGDIAVEQFHTKI